MNQQFHTPSFGDEVFELNDTTDSAKRMRNLDYPSSSMEDYHSIETIAPSIPVISPLSTTRSTLSISSPSQVQASSRKQVAVITPLSSFSSNATPSTKESLNLEPAKPLSPYALFFRDTVNAIKTQNPTCTFQEISVIVSKMWETLDDTHKNHYNQKHEYAKQEYLTAMRIYSQKSEPTHTNEQSKPQNGTSSNILKTNFSQLARQDNQREQLLSSPTLTMAATIVTSADNTTPSNSTNITGITSVAFSTDGIVASPHQQIQLLTEAAAAQKCTRENCNKPAIINPDWEDEYCSNECVVIHCRTVFNDWVKSKMNSSPAAVTI